MYQNQKHHIEDRIVNLTQPHVRPIVRGKAKAKVEFGAKIAISMVNGYDAVLALQLFVMNLAHKLRVLFASILIVLKTGFLGLRMAV